MRKQIGAVLIGAIAAAAIVSGVAFAVPPPSQPTYKCNLTPGCQVQAFLAGWWSTALGYFVPTSTDYPMPVTMTSGASFIGSVSVSKPYVSTTLTKVTGAGTYTGASTTAPQAICHDASVTPCAPVTITVSATTLTVNGNAIRVRMIKTTNGTIGAAFRVLLYQGAPTLAGVFNGSTYTPLAADILSAAYIGSWDCQTPSINATDGSAYYDCAPNSPSGNNAFSLADGQLRAVFLAIGPYVSGSSEQFTALVDAFASAP